MTKDKDKDENFNSQADSLETNVDIELKILNRSYFLRCSEKNAHQIQKASEKLNAKANETVKCYPGLSTDNAILITSMNLIDNEEEKIQNQQWITINILKKFNTKLKKIIDKLDIDVDEKLLSSTSNDLDIY